ncbi:SAM-dependent methyltransferase [Acinetobacter baumannii]|jgi:adenine-specific DNA-methyltransferase|uniref:site-specific DNA-methyltransferase (adenine-specific) n=5 Tax=Moraxellaceae TaxID=468 RepID=A0AB73FGR0_ACIBA|nr:Eco57I restriction-modification methylase domain-containing protein [Acinetobacter baumannii]KQE18776.1 methyltransferase [Acinetobacter pittii]EHU1393150.1 Eco57I restriction-modification methylase domain-containing protein [Acinetobacter baumannii]KQD22014.1 methyltransferase [Acinetobacter baumannii]KQE25356.1 methyltransferase [Acinetobacter pittii]
MNLMTIEHIRKVTNSKLDPKKKSELGQYMTPSVIAEYMASLFTLGPKNIKLLDCGAGIGSLTVSAIKRLKDISLIELWEIDPIMQEQLEINMQTQPAPSLIHKEDFILGAVENLLSSQGERYTHAILNPPYKKINSNSVHRKALRKVGIETVNLYSAFLALTILLMEQDGQIIAIIPRSFCNGPYYKPFRELILKECSIEHIHIFESRDMAFKDDEVLQENIIIKLVKGKPQTAVEISQSNDQNFNDYQCKIVPFTEVIRPNDPELFIRIATNSQPQEEDNPVFSFSLSELGLFVSTGPIVSHRMKEFLQQYPQDDSAPLFYPHHFFNKQLEYPKEHKKPNAIRVTPDSQKWLMPNNGFYVIVRRFSSKEEKRRIVANVIDPSQIDKKWIGFDNCWNVFHIKKQGFDYETAMGLACFLNSTMLDEYFRVFSGHTQVNATDLRNMKYPSLKNLQILGKKYDIKMTQDQIDKLVEGIK